MSQPIPVGLYTRPDFDADLKRFKPVRKNVEVSKRWSCCIFIERNWIVELKDSTQQELRKD